MVQQNKSTEPSHKILFVALAPNLLYKLDQRKKKKTLTKHKQAPAQKLHSCPTNTNIRRRKSCCIYVYTVEHLHRINYFKPYVLQRISPRFQRLQCFLLIPAPHLECIGKTSTQMLSGTTYQHACACVYDVYDLHDHPL